MTKAILFLFFSLMISTLVQAAPTVAYELAMSQPNTHYFEVTIFVSGYDKPTADFKMPVWTPGSYLIREYSKNVEGAGARSAQGSVLALQKTNKNTWRVETKGVKSFSFNYKVYAFELSVRNAYVDKNHAYLNPAAVFMVLSGEEKSASTLKIIPSPDWKKTSTALRPFAPNQFNIPDWDTFVDSPIEIGNHDAFTFEAAGVPHEVAIFGGGNYDFNQLTKDITKIIVAETAIFGEHPCKHYTFIIHNIPNGGGGLEHLNSTTLQADPYGYQDDRSYTGFLALVAHEYFHLWNGKRVRPAALGPFNYDEENYTTSLWVAEGITSYYDDYILLRAGLIKQERYLEILANTIGSVDNTPGSKIQTLAESSFDAWIKYYRPNENSNNSTVGYYTKGTCVGLLLDLKIREVTNGKKSLDDVMKGLYNTYYKKEKRGYTEKEFAQMASDVAGLSLNSLLESALFTTQKLDYDPAFEAVGLNIKDANVKRNDPYLGAALKTENGRFVVSNVARDSPAWHDGLSVNDEVVALNGYRLASDWAEIIKLFKPKDKINVLIARGGVISTVDITLGRNPNVAYKITKSTKTTPQVAALGESWLATKP